MGGNKYYFREKQKKIGKIIILFICFASIFLIAANQIGGEHITIKAAVDDFKSNFAAMFTLGILSATGSIISLAIPLSGHDGYTFSAAITKFTSGFLLGTFGGSLLFDFFSSRAPEGVSVTSIVGLVVLVISILGVTTIQAIFFLGKQWLWRKGGNADEK